MTPEELTAAVEALRVFDAEVTDIEVKAARDELPRSVREAVAAFANSQGGVIILGIDEADGFTASGVANPARLAASLTDILNTDFEPPVRAVVNPMSFESTVVIVAEVPPVPLEQRPCFIRAKGMANGSWVRSGASNRRLTSYEVQLMLASRGQPKNDEVVVPDTSLDDLDDAAVRTYLARLRAVRPSSFSDASDLDILGRTRVIERGTGSLTLAGLLTLGRHPQDWFPQLNATFVHYPDDDPQRANTDLRFLDNVAVDGSIPVMVRDGLAAIVRNLRRRSVITGAGRIDVLEYPLAALREALANALVHRDLSELAHGTQVQIELYPSRLVIRNPGGLHGPVAVDALFQDGVSSSRNSRLLRMLEDVPIPGEDRTVVENRGSGIRTMVRALREAGMNLPRFHDAISTFTVTFPNHTLYSEEAIRWIESLEQSGLSDTQITALAEMRSGTTLDNPAYRALTGVDSRVATAELQDLVARGITSQEGARRWARYGLHETSAAPKARLRRDDRRPSILRALGEQARSVAEIAEALGLPKPTVRHWLKRMLLEGSVAYADPTSSPRSPNTRYVAVQPELPTPW